MNARELNQTIRYTMWSVFRLRDQLGDVDRAPLAEELQGLFDELSDQDVVLRGCYDVSAWRADADLMLWWHAPEADDLQAAYNRFRRSGLGRACEPRWSQLALHRPAEFNKSHLPAFLQGEDPKPYVSVYPFVRSYDWYLLPDEERRALLVEHGKMARDYSDVQTNTVPAFALGDYEWMLAFEADELHRITDLMRELRGAKARLYTREEVPFFAGRRRPIGEIVERLP